MGGWTIALKAFWQIEIKGLILCRWDQKVTFAQSYIFFANFRANEWKDPPFTYFGEAIDLIQNALALPKIS